MGAGHWDHLPQPLRQRCAGIGIQNVELGSSNRLIWMNESRKLALWSLQELSFTNLLPLYSVQVSQRVNKRVVTDIKIVGGGWGSHPPLSFKIDFGDL